MENLKMASKCNSCKRDCKKFILCGEIQYCPDYINVRSTKTIIIHKKDTYINERELVKI